MPCIDGAYCACFHLAPDEGSETGLLEAAVRSFAAAGAAGAFPAPGYSPEQSHLALLPDVVKGMDRVRFTFQAKRMDSRAFQVLRNMFTGSENKLVACIRLEIHALRDGEPRGLTVPVPDEDNEDAMYPALSREAASLMTWEDSDFQKSRRCLVEFRNALEAETVRKLSAWITPWSDLLESGGFSLPVVSPRDAQCLSGSVSQFDEFTAEIGVDRFMASERAWDVLANMLCRFGQIRNPVFGILID